MSWFFIAGLVVDLISVAGDEVDDDGIEEEGEEATADATDSNPRDSFNISAPNCCRAVIVDGVGSGML